MVISGDRYFQEHCFFTEAEGNITKVDDGLKITKALNTTLTYLVTGEKDNELEEFLVQFKKYEKLLLIIEEIPAEKLDLVRRMLELIKTDSLTTL